MKVTLSVIVSFIFISCEFKSDRQLEHSNPELSNGQILFDHGFLDFVDSAKLNQLKSELVNSFYIYNDDNFKIANIDAEELAEFNFDFFVPRLSRILKKRNFELVVRVAVDVEDTNDIYINETKIELYSKEELDEGNFWDSGPRNFFKEINRQLERKSIKESFYLLYGANDLHVLLLTKQQYSIIANHYKDNQKEIPYLP